MENMAEETIEVLGMTCKGCARTIYNELSRFEGVEFSVSLENKKVVVKYPKDRYRREDFEAAIENHGYGVRGKSERTQ